MKVTVTSLNSKLFSHAGKWWAAPETDEWKVQYEQTPRHPSLCWHLPPPWLPLSSRGGGWVAQREGLQQTVSDRRPDKPHFVYKQGMLALHVRFAITWMNAAAPPEYPLKSIMFCVPQDSVMFGCADRRPAVLSQQRRAESCDSRGGRQSVQSARCAKITARGKRKENSYIF